MSVVAPISVFPLSLNDEEIDVIDVDDMVDDNVMIDEREERSNFDLNGSDEHVYGITQ